MINRNNPAENNRHPNPSQPINSAKLMELRQERAQTSSRLKEQTQKLIEQRNKLKEIMRRQKKNQAKSSEKSHNKKARTKPLQGYDPKVDERKIQSLTDKIQLTEQTVEHLRANLESLDEEILEEERFEAEGYFGRSALGRAVSGIVQAAAVPITMGMEFAVRHPFVAGWIALSTYAFAGASAAVTEGQTLSEQRQAAMAAKSGSTPKPSYTSTMTNTTTAKPVVEKKPVNQHTNTVTTQSETTQATTSEPTDSTSTPEPSTSIEETTQETVTSTTADETVQATTSTTDESTSTPETTPPPIATTKPVFTESSTAESKPETSTEATTSTTEASTSSTNTDLTTNDIIEVAAVAEVTTAAEPSSETVVTSEVTAPEVTATSNTVEVATNEVASTFAPTTTASASATAPSDITENTAPSTSSPTTTAPRYTDLGARPKTSTIKPRSSTRSKPRTTRPSASSRTTAKPTTSTVNGKQVRQIGNCLRDEYSVEDSMALVSHTVTNICEGKSASGYIKNSCNADSSKQGEWAPFSLENQGDSASFETWTWSDCPNQVYEGVPPTASRFSDERVNKADYCLNDHYANNDNGTVSHRVSSYCTEASAHGFIKKGCKLGADPNTWSEFEIKPDGAPVEFLAPDTPECQNPVRFGVPTQSYEDKLCVNGASSHPELPKPEKIIAGEAMPRVRSRHVVKVAKKGTICTGTVIGQKHILTAAHCITKNNQTRELTDLDDIRVLHDPIPEQIPELLRNRIQVSPVQSHKVVAAHIPPQYYFRNDSSMDLGLLELENPIFDPSKIRIADRSDFCEFGREALDRAQATCATYPARCDGNYDRNKPIWQTGNAVVQGFGMQRNQQGQLVSANALHEGDIVAVSINGENAEGLIITEPSNSGGNTCFGDSGGPLIYEKKDGERVQVGVASSGVGSECNQANHFTNLNNPDIRKWLEERTRESAATSVIEPGDGTRARPSPDTCVAVSDRWDGIWGPVTGKRRITFENKCDPRHRPGEVNIRFHTSAQQEEIENIGDIEGNLHQAETIRPGETRVYHVSSREAKAHLSWTDLDRAKQQYDPRDPDARKQRSKND